jgi:hypothetical protein
LCKTGGFNQKSSHKFDPKKKITEIEVIISKDEYTVDQINFYENEEILVQTMMSNDEFWKYGSSGRKEVFRIAQDEKLIGCKIE